MVEADVVAVHRHLLAVQEGAEGNHVLAKEVDGGRGTRADLSHPVLDAVADGQTEPAREQPGHRRDLHRRDRHVPQRRRHEAQPDGELLGARERCGGGRDAGSEEAVLPHPQTRDAEALGLSGGLDEVLGRQLGAVDGSDDGGHGSTLSSPGARRRRGGTDRSAPDAGSGNRP